MTLPPQPILLLSTADWDNPFWTNKQHVARELARLGFTIVYVESLGLRRPTAARRDLERVWRRLLRGLRPARQAERRVWVCSPLILPLHGWPLVASANRMLVGLAIAAACRRARVRPRLLWTYSPLTADLLDLSRFDRVIYHAVDDIAAQPGMPTELIRSCEPRLMAKADVVFTTSPALQARAEALNPQSHLLPNVADFDHFARALTLTPDADVSAFKGPRIGFVGAVSAYKLDVALLCAVARLRPHYRFLLVGEAGEGEPNTDISALRAEPNIHLLGPRSHANLPAVLAGFDVAIIPAPANAYTRSMSPMKAVEYLAAGRPVVSTPLPALEGLVPPIRIADGPEAFADALDAAVAGRAPPLEARLDAARGRTYAARTARMLEIIAAAPSPR